MPSWKAFAGLLIGAVFAAGCGGGSSPEATDTPDSPPAEPTPAAADAAPPQMPGGPPAGGHGGPPAGGPAETQMAAAHGAPGAQADAYGGPDAAVPTGGPPPGYPGGRPPGYGPPGGHGAGGAAPQMAHGAPTAPPGYPGGPPPGAGSAPPTASSSNPLQGLFGGIDSTIKGESPSGTPVAGIPGPPGAFPGAAAPGGYGAGAPSPDLPANLGAPGGAPGFPGAAAQLPGEMPAEYPGAPEGYPGAPDGYPGAPGAAGGPAQEQAPTADEGTPEYAVQKLVIQVARGDLTGLDEVISARATGVLAQMREGELPEERLEKLKTQMARVKLLSRRGDGLSYNLFLQNDQGEVLHFTCRREGEDYLVREFAVREAAKRRPRR